MRGILMIKPLYHQTIAGKKTMTRRSGGLEMVNETIDLIEDENEPGNYIEVKRNCSDEWDPPVWVEERINKNRTISLVEFMRPGDRSTVIQCAPRYKVGEVLYIKEPYGYIPVPPDPDKLIYRFDQNENNFTDRFMAGHKLWKNKLFMPADKAREFVRITGIKCERLLDISDEDCIAEGIEASGFGDGYYINYLMDVTYGYDYLDNTPKESFISLYKFANKIAKVGSVPPHGSLSTPPDIDNIWVWCYSFEYLPNYKL